MPNNKKNVINNVNSHIPSTASSNPKKFEYSYNDIIVVSPSKIPEKSKRLSPHSSCGSSTSSAFSSYCNTSCNSSRCSKRHANQTSSSSNGSETSSSDSSTISYSGSCHSDCTHSHKSLSSSNAYSNSNISSYSSSMSSQSLSISPNSLDTRISDSTDDKLTIKSEKRFTRSSLSASDISTSNISTSNISTSNKSMSRNSSYTTSNSSDISSENSNATSVKSSSTVVTTKITRSTASNILTKESLRSSTSALNRVTPIDESAAKKECLWYRCKYVGHATDVDDSLLNHIKREHIYSQKDLKRFRCMWRECSVYGKSAFHFNWLERHVIDHIEKNPYMCIFDGCKRKFRTEEAREKHCQTHINNSENSNPVHQNQSSSVSPIKGRNNMLLNTAKMALIQNIKNKTTSVPGKLKSAKPSMNYSQILKTLTKKRKLQAMTLKKFKKAHFKDFLDDFSIKMIGSKLMELNYNSGKFTFSAEIIGTRTDTTTNAEAFLIQWNPKNIIDNEWIEKDNLHKNLKKELTLSELKVKANSMNPFYRTHRFRPDRRK